MSKRLTVVGDTLLDVDLVGSVSRVCPDAPVPVVDLEHRTRRAGGAGLTATLAAADGLSVTLVTAVAGDEAGRTLLGELGDLDTVIGPARAATPVKTRLRGAGQSIARIDEGGGGVPPAVTDEMLDAVCAADAVLVSDYGRGITADERLRSLLAHLATHKPVVWDPHPRGSTPVPNTTLVCPNQDEALSFAACGDAATAAGKLRERWSVGAVAVTMGAAGALLDDGTSFPAPSVVVTDPCGAGDRFAAAAAGSLMTGGTVDVAVRAAVDAAARFLADGGVASLSRRNVLALPQGPAHEVAAAVRARGGTVVATGGCFDLLHAGHVHTLAAARELGDCLIVCLNSDRSVRRLKGVGRPINTEADRVDVLASLSCVDAVVVFDEDTPEAILNELRPDIWVKGRDYPSPEALPENRLLRVWGGRTVLVPERPGRSTTRLATALRRVG